MPCQPLTESDFDAGAPPFGFNIGSVSFPDFDIPFPDLPLEYLEELFNMLGMLLPSGMVKPNFEPDSLNSIMSGIMSLLNTFTPYLMLYKFFLPVLNLILCILEVLCSIPKPIKIIRSLRRLFRVCIPEFLSLFPFFALILMIIALILLIIALIEYIIARILQIIETILRNILLLAKATSALNSDSIMAIVKKIGNLLCILQNIFILFSVFNTIFQIIKAIMSLSFKIPPCDTADGSDDGCCTPDVCPEFLKENETIIRSDGHFQYLNQVGIDSGVVLPPPFPPFVSTIREESWQFYSPESLGAGGPTQEFINITHAYDLPESSKDTIFFPEGTNYTEKTQYKGVPYYISFNVNYNPTDFGRPATIPATRIIKIVNAIVKNPPITDVLDFENNPDATESLGKGVLNLVGGTITEDNGDQIKFPNGDGYTINTFFHNPITVSSVLTDTTILFPNVDYTFTINHPVLLSAGLITAGCVPSVAMERDWLAATVGQQFNDVGSKIIDIPIPDVGAAQQGINDAITKYREKVSTDTTNEFKDTILGILDGLRADSVAALKQAISAGYDQYKSDFFVEPAIQFTTKSIKVKVALKEASGQSLSTNLPIDAAADMALNFSTKTTFGEIIDFTYDGSLYFVADITSLMSGNGTIQVAYENKFIGTLNNQSDLSLTPSISIKTISYTFVKSQVLEGFPSRDDTDISGGV